MRVLVAPDKFKGSVTAAQAAAAIGAGLRRARPDLEVVELPVADGGDGTVAAALAAGFTAVRVTAAGPTGEPAETTFALSADLAGSGGTIARTGIARGDGIAGGDDIAAGGGIAVVELADVVGLRRLPSGPAPLTASTYGVGQVIRAALDHGATTIVLGLGGSASTDGGAGMVQALGVSLTDDRGAELARGGAALAGLIGVDLAGLDGRLRTVRFLVACDVGNPLLGPTGAAAVFGPQKGATPADVALLDRALARWADLTGSVLDSGLVSRFASAPGLPGHSGGAGGTGSMSGISSMGSMIEAGQADVAGADVAGGDVAGGDVAGGDVPGRDVASIPGAGAAGGTGFAAVAYLGAQLLPGIDLVLDLIGFDAELAGTGLVITGEGNLDRQTLAGKAPLGVARAAARHGVPVAAVAGQVLLTAEEISAAGFAAAFSLAGLEPDPARSMAMAAQLLEQAGSQIGTQIGRRLGSQDGSGAGSWAGSGPAGGRQRSRQPDQQPGR